MRTRSPPHTPARFKKTSTTPRPQLPERREASLFHDNVPVAVYDSLIDAVHAKLPAVYKYLELRRKKMKLRDIHHYDTYVPILSELDTRHTWDQAVRGCSRFTANRWATNTAACSPRASAAAGAIATRTRASAAAPSAAAPSTAGRIF